jgi:hypothetical protein
MDPQVTAALIGVFATFAAVVFGIALQQRSNRARLTFDMYAEFNNSEFTRARADAARILDEHPLVTFENLTKTLPAESRDVWLVVQFYQKLWIAIKYGHVSKAMISDLFGSIFFYWYLNHFEAMLAPVDYPATENLKELKGWFDHVDLAQPHKHKWVERALKERDTPSNEKSLPSISLSA